MAGLPRAALGQRLVHASDFAEHKHFVAVMQHSVQLTDAETRTHTQKERRRERRREEGRERERERGRERDND